MALVRKWTASSREDAVSEMIYRAREIPGLPEVITDAVLRIVYPHGSGSLRDEIAPILTTLNEGETTEATTTLAELLVEALDAEEVYPYGNPLDIDFKRFDTLEEVTTHPSADDPASEDTIAPKPWLVVVDLPNEAPEESRIKTAFQTATALTQGITVFFVRPLPPLAGGEEESRQDLWDPFLMAIGTEERVFLYASKDDLWEDLFMNLLQFMDLLSQ